jgi:hypothetical protein
MPSIVHQSPDLAFRGIALVDQSLARQPSGLVNVVVQYVVPATRLSQILPQFEIDSPPPIHPDLIDRDELQTRRLYLENFTVDKEAGLTYINAQYAGALTRGLATPYQTNQFERGTTDMPIASLSESGQIGGNDNDGFSFSQPLFDEYRFAFRTRIVSYEIAAVDLVDFEFTPPPIAQTINQDGLIIGWQIVFSQFAGEASFNQYVYLPAYYKRNYTAAQWLEYIVASNERLPRLQTNIETEIDNITPRVKLIRKRVSLFVPPSLLLL